jgi:dolichyl-phosphate-mannose-protein mannosyltransferase
MRRSAVLNGVAIAAMMLAVMIGPRDAYAYAANANLLNNGDFARGAGTSCDGWRVDAWILSSTATEFRWVRPTGGAPAEVEIDTHHDNDARWVQTVPLGPGWYYVSVEARTEKILPFFIGATISVLEDSIMSDNLKRTNDWTKLGFYLRVGPKGGDVDVALRLGGFMNLNRGKVFFRRASVVRVSGPPPGEQHVFDLEQIRKDEVTGPIGQTWSLVAVFLMFIILAATGWWLFSESIA